MVKVERTFPAPVSLETESKKVTGSYSEQSRRLQHLKDIMCGKIWSSFRSLRSILFELKSCCIRIEIRFAESYSNTAAFCKPAVFPACYGVAGWPLPDSSGVGISFLVPGGSPGSFSVRFSAGVPMEPLMGFIMPIFIEPISEISISPVSTNVFSSCVSEVEPIVPSSCP